MKYFLMSALMLTTHVYVGYFIVAPMVQGTFSWWTIPVLLLLGAVIVLTFLLGLLFFHISIQPISKYHSISSALLHYVIEYGMLRSGRAAMKKLRVVCERPREYQEILLKQLLRENKDTIYGKRYKFAEIRNLKDFREKHPLTDYEHFKPYIQDIAKGKKNVLSGEPPVRLSLTSGTTGEPKMLPTCESFLKKDYNELGGLVSAVSRESFPDWDIMQRRIWFYCNPTLTKSEGGLPIGPLSTIPEWAKSLLVVYATPGDGFNIGTTFESTYVHLLFGLRDRDIGFIFPGFSTTLLTAMQLLEKEWEHLVEDLATGKLNPNLKINSEIRQSLERALGSGDKQRASELQQEFRQGFDGIIQRVWPNISYIMSIDITNLKPTLASSYAKGVPMFSHCYGATEGIIGLNVTPLQEEEDFLLTASYTIFEFIPEKDMSNTKPKTYFINELEVGRNYEVVVSIPSGLYRFRFGDVVQVTGYYQECPKVKFLYRSGALLNLFGEKLNQAVVLEALDDVMGKVPDAELVYYAAAESTLLSGLNESSDGNRKPYYIFFLELKFDDSDYVIEKLRNVKFEKLLDASLGHRHHYYKHLRNGNQIGEPIVHVVGQGTFSKLQEYILEHSTATANQLKMPTKLRTPGMLTFMLEEAKAKVLDINHS